VVRAQLPLASVNVEMTKRFYKKKILVSPRAEQSTAICVAEPVISILSLRLTRLAEAAERCRNKQVADEVELVDWHHDIGAGSPIGRDADLPARQSNIDL